MNKPHHSDRDLLRAVLGMVTPIPDKDSCYIPKVLVEEIRKAINN